MKNLILLLLLANILYFMWGRFVEEPEETGVVVVQESELGPPLAVTRSTSAEAAASVGAGLGTGKPAEYGAEGMRTGMRSTEGQLFIGHWVQIRNIPDREAGNEMLAKLRDGGLGDAYLVPTEEEGLKISLGLFGEKSRAERIELQAKSMGLPADITPRMRDATIFYVDIGLTPGRGAGPMIDKYGEDMVRLRDQATCPRSN